MIADTSVWVDHLRGANALLADRLRAGEIWIHPFVVGELACGQLRRRDELLGLLGALPQAQVVEHAEALAFVESRGLAAAGIGWVDVHLLASAAVARRPLWTLDRRLGAAARRLGLAPPDGASSRSRG